MVLTILISVFVVLSPAQPASAFICTVPSLVYSNIQAAANDPVCHQIDVAAGTFTESITISRDVIIMGQGPASTTVQAATGPGIATSRVVTVNAGTNVTIEGLTIRHGKATPDNSGGGIENAGTLTITSSTISGNASSNGGGIRNGGTLTITTTTISGNTSVNGEGGGIFGSQASTLTITSSTISGNASGNDGGGIANFEMMTITNSTISGNTSVSGQGGGIFNLFGTLTITNSIIMNSLSGGDCAGNSAGSNNLLDMPATCPGISIGAVTNFDLTLADNGGPTLTHALLPGSNAIDAGIGDCLGVPLLTDQRGVARADFAPCDIGAYEFPACPSPLNTNTTLTADCTGKIVIGQDSITLDCNGFTVTGVGNSIFLTNRDGVTVQNCTVTGANKAFVLSSTTNSLIRWNTVKNSTDGFFVIAGFTGTTGNTFEGNTVINNSRHGFLITANATGNTYTGNTSDNNGEFGFLDYTSGPGPAGTGNTYTGNQCLGNTFGGSTPIGLCFAGNPDVDGDGIFNEVDTLPETLSDAFSAIGLGGTTTGTITDLGDQNLTISKEPSPNGVKITDTFGGIIPATFTVCSGSAEFPLLSGDEVVVTCGSVTIEVVREL